MNAQLTRIMLRKNPRTCAVPNAERGSVADLYAVIGALIALCIALAFDL